MSKMFSSRKVQGFWSSEYNIRHVRLVCTNKCYQTRYTVLPCGLSFYSTQDRSPEIFPGIRSAFDRENNDRWLRKNNIHICILVLCSVRSKAYYLILGISVHLFETNRVTEETQLKLQNTVWQSFLSVDWIFLLV